MMTFACPVTGRPVTVSEADLRSVHRVAAGRVAYARCVCGGLAVLVTDGHDWCLTGHGGAVYPEGRLPGRTAAARCA